MEKDVLIQEQNNFKISYYFSTSDSKKRNLPNLPINRD